LSFIDFVPIIGRMTANPFYYTTLLHHDPLVLRDSFLGSDIVTVATLSGTGHQQTLCEWSPAGNADGSL
jgi:hypothetical protein